jgi:hypothetical protein
MSITPSGYVKARSEILSLFGWNADSLSPDETLRIDCAVALRLALDDLQGRIVRGESADVARMLTASEALARLLPPAVLATPPAEEHGDPRVEMLRIYMQMRERGEIGLTADRVAELEGEVERLRGQLVDAGIVPALPDVPMAATVTHVAVGKRVGKDGGSTAIDPTEVVPPGEWRGERYARPGPDDPAPRSAAIIEGKANPPLAAGAPAKPVRPQNWDDSDHGKAWRSWVDAGGGGVFHDRWSNRNF